MMSMINTKSLLPPMPRPPHDPTWWLLNAQVGWRAARLEHVAQRPTDQALTLRFVPGSGRSLAEESGSFGGLTLPINVALGSDDVLYVLDNQTLDLKRFDPCQCLFETVPCFGGEGDKPRQLQNPHGIRLSVFSLRGFVLRAFWKPPSTAELANRWEPYAVAFDSRGRVFVTDGANGCIHRFSPTGRWEACLPGFGQITHIAVDCQDRLYGVVDDGEQKRVRVVDKNGENLAETLRPRPVAETNEDDSDRSLRPEEVADHFPALPFAVDAQGNLHLEAFCESAPDDCGSPARLPSPGVFDRYGHPVTEVINSRDPVYHPEGFFFGQALDSKLYRCQWHRVVLQGQIPAGSRILVLTYTAETLQSSEHVWNLPDETWETRQIIHELDGDEWDCLVRSGGGRYLWLKLQFRGNGSVSPAIDSIRVEFPRISLQRYLPAAFREDPSGSDFGDRFLSLFDTTLRRIERIIDHQARYFDPLSTPAEPDPKTGLDFLSWLASWIGLTLDRHWPEAKRRQFVKRAARLYHLRGTRTGLWRQLLFYLGFEPDTICCANDQPEDHCRPKPANCAPVERPPCAWQPPPLILEHYQLRRWLFLEAGRLGDQAMLWGQRIVNRSRLEASAQVGRSQLITTQDPYRDPFHVYAHKFSVFVPACYGRIARHRKGLENLIKAGKPAHTYFQLEYVEPRFRIGVQSMIGLDSVVGRYPEGVTLAETPLGVASVLSEPPQKRSGPSLQVGRQARVGSSTKLD
jgi:phage tail-like protein